MKHITKRFFSLLLVFCSLLALTACGGEGGGKDAAPDVDYDGYTIVYQDVAGGRLLNAASEVRVKIGRTKGALPKIATAEEAAAPTAQEILVGKTGRSESTEATKDFVLPMDYTIRNVDGKLVIVGGTPYATAAACDYFVTNFEANEKEFMKPGFVYDYHYNPELLNPIALDPDSFEPVWTSVWTPQEWMTDPFESMYAVTHKTNRLAALSHRDDFVNYPRGSLQGVISSAKAGADAVELDFRITKDNIPVVLHDESLAVNTDCNSKRGRNGLPDSEYVGDWTYEQILELNMVCDNGRMTEYKIPTLYEAMLAGAKLDAIMTFDDKADETAHPVFAATDHTNVADMVDLMQATDSMQCFLYYYARWYGMGTDTAFWHTIENPTAKFTEWLDFWEKCLADNQLQKVFAFFNDDRYKSWGYANNTSETPYYWDKWFGEGNRVMWSNNAVNCCKYINETFKPCDYSAFRK